MWILSLAWAIPGIKKTAKAVTDKINNLPDAGGLLMAGLPIGGFAGVNFIDLSLRFKHHNCAGVCMGDKQQQVLFLKIYCAMQYVSICRNSSPHIALGRFLDFLHLNLWLAEWKST
ncbi:MAG: hypothetical protein IPJ01_00455 [Micavibrio sp.]|jgi:hypothetical protein|nr:hypothetical protein [Micavibrio sp.]